MTETEAKQSNYQEKRGSRGYSETNVFSRPPVLFKVLFGMDRAPVR